MDKVRFYRKRLDKIDELIAINIARKIDVVLEFWKWKKENKIPLIDKKREKEIAEKNARMSGLREEFIKKIYDDIREEIKLKWQKK